jgi:hypothetical protein
MARDTERPQLQTAAIDFYARLFFNGFVWQAESDQPL